MICKRGWSFWLAAIVSYKYIFIFLAEKYGCIDIDKGAERSTDIRLEQFKQRRPSAGGNFKKIIKDANLGESFGKVFTVVDQF